MNVCWEGKFCKFLEKCTMFHGVKRLAEIECVNVRVRFKQIGNFLTNQQPKYIFNCNIVFHFRHILFLQNLPIHLLFLFHMHDHHLAKGLSLSLVHASGIHSLLIPKTRLLYQYSTRSRLKTRTHLFKIAFPPYRLFPIYLDCLSGFWIFLFSFLPYRMTPAKLFLGGHPTISLPENLGFSSFNSNETSNLNPGSTFQS